MDEQKIITSTDVAPTARKTIYSGIQPTGCITIGNYIGAINNWRTMQNEYNSIFSIVDMHSLTVRQVPSELRNRSLSFFAQYLACGIDPEKSIIYFQSHVPEHAMLTWILNCFTYIGELERMTQFKEKSLKNSTNLNAGLLDYPVLMASDILLYNTDVVPIGADQKQHLELTRDIAIRFNNIYGDVFTVPEPYIPKIGAKIASLQNPTAKMSKSDPDENGAIAIIDSPDVIMRKIKRSVTDSEGKVYFSEEKPGVSNLLTIYSVFSDKTMEQCVSEFDGLGYADLKNRVGESIVERLKPIQDTYARLMKDKSYLSDIAKKGAEKASAIAYKTVRKVYKKVGFYS